MKASRRTGSLQKTAFGGGAGDIRISMTRPQDPFWYWRQNNLPFDYMKPEENPKIRAYLRLIYITHPVIASCIDIFSSWPMTGIHLESKDKELEKFYTDHFMNDLDYEEYTQSVLKEYFLCGEAFPLGQFNETLGVWDDDELVNPDDVKVIRTPFSKEPRFQMKIPEYIRKILEDPNPDTEWEAKKIRQSYPELVRFAQVDEYMPVSNVLLKQLANKADTFHDRGLSIVMRAFRSIHQEEMLNSAVDSIASRLYTPLILAKIGAPAGDLGTDIAWVPTDAQLEDFEGRLDAALAADFRVLITHFATSMESVFGREVMPDFSGDYDRVLSRQLQAFGLSETMLTGACLTGDTVIHVNRALKGSRMTIEHLYKRFSDHTKTPGHPWDYDIPTYVDRAEGDVVRLGLIDNVWFSGVKEVFELTTESGKKIKASARHPFLTDRGWVLLGDLNVGDSVRVNTWRRAGLRKVPNRYRFVFTHYHPHQVSNGQEPEREQRWKVPQHRIVMDSMLNEMSYDQFLSIVRGDPIRAKELVYLPPTMFVHHIDENHLNNDPSNLSIMTASDHSSHHADVNNVLWQVGSERIVSIVSKGEQPTYDLSLQDDPHNFLANDFVVHNSDGQTYAADALNRDIVTVKLTRAQKIIKRLYEDRAYIVAEAQQHYDYDERGGKRYVEMEEVYEVDEETGQGRIVEQPKLLIPEMKFDVLNLQDENQQRQFVEALRASGIPISDQTRLTNVPIDLDEEMELSRKEIVKKAIEAAETEKEVFLELRRKNLPIPQDLADKFTPKVLNADEIAEQQAAQEGMPLPATAMEPDPNNAILAPTPQDYEMGDDEQQTGSAEPGMPAQPVPGQAMIIPLPGVNRPPESSEQLAGMPRKAALEDSEIDWKTPHDKLAQDPRIKKRPRWIKSG